MARDTSIEAYQELKASGRLDDRQKQIWQVAKVLVEEKRLAGETHLWPTGSEITKKDRELNPGASPYSEGVRNRIRELRDSGWMREHDKVKCPLMDKMTYCYEPLDERVPPPPDTIRKVVVPLRVETYRELRKYLAKNKVSASLAGQVIADVMDEAVEGLNV